MTPLGHLAVCHVESSEAGIWKQHRPEQVEFIHPGMMFEVRRYPVHQMDNQIEIDGMMNGG